MQFTAEIIAQFLGGTIEGNPSAMVTTVAKIEEASSDALVFLSNPKYEEYLYSTKASITIVNRDLELKEAVTTTLIRVDNAYESFAKLLDLYVQNMPKKSGIRPLASISESASLGEDVYVGEFAVLDEDVTVGDGTQIYPHVYVGDNVSIGKNCVIYSGVKIYQDCVIGDNVILQSGAVIGGDGFGFAPTEDGSFRKIPQIGNVILEDFVEIGANTCIDRATMGSTVIKKGVKLDNLIQIGHNVVVGEDTVMAAQCGVAGSTKLGRGIMMGGQVGIVGHLTIADGVKIGSQSGIGHNVTDQGAVMLGSPAMQGSLNHKVQAILKKLPDMNRELSRLSREMKKLTETKEA